MQSNFSFILFTQKLRKVNIILQLECNMVQQTLKRAHAKIYRKAREIGISEIVFGIGFGLIAFIFNLVFHEFAHYAVAVLLGYPARIEGLFVFEGWTTVYADITNPTHLALIAAAGPMACLALGEYFWRFGRRSPFRYVAMILWFFGALPNLIPLPARDAWYLYNTIGPAWSWFIFLIAFGYVWARFLFDGVGPADWEEWIT